MSTPEEKLNSPTHSGPARCTLEQLRARWGAITWPPREDGRGLVPLRSGETLVFHGMSGRERWKVEKIEGKRVDLVQEVET